MSWFNTSKCHGDGLTRVVKTEVDLSDLTLNHWTENELGLRLAIIFPQVDGYGHLTASEEIKTEIRSIMGELERRGLDPISNLRWNEQVQGFGWLSGFTKLNKKS